MIARVSGTGPLRARGIEDKNNMTEAAGSNMLELGFRLYSTVTLAHLVPPRTHIVRRYGFDNLHTHTTRLRRHLTRAA